MESRRVIPWLLTLMLVLLGCGGEPDKTGDPAKNGPVKPKREKPLVVCSLPVLGELAQAIAGSHVEVRSLALPGDDPATFALRPTDLALIEEAAVIFIVSEKLERNVYEAVRQRGKLVVLSHQQGSRDKVRLLDDASAGNWHLWMCETNYRDLANDMLLHLGERAKLDRQAQDSAMREHLAKHSAAWRAAQLKVQPADSAATRLPALTNDPAAQYFLHQVGFDAKLIDVDPEKIPTEADRDALDARLAKEKPTLLAFDTARNPTLHEMLTELADKHKIKIVTGLKGRWLDEPGTPTDTLIGVIEYNAGLLATPWKE